MSDTNQVSWLQVFISKLSRWHSDWRWCCRLPGTHCRSVLPTSRLILTHLSIYLCGGCSWLVWWCHIKVTLGHAPHPHCDLFHSFHLHQFTPGSQSWWRPQFWGELFSLVLANELSPLSCPPLRIPMCICVFFFLLMANVGAHSLYQTRSQNSMVLVHVHASILCCSFLGNSIMWQCGM